MKLPEPPYPLRDAAYYQRLHEEEAGYQTNNWLLEELDQIRAFGAESLLEIACGNGRFIESAAPFFKRVTGCDWAVSPRIQGVLSRNPNVSFQRVDMYRDLPLGQPDLVVSADFLEHLAPETLPEILRRIDSLSAKAFHKIACYDDGHSHLSIMPPGKWLALLRDVDPRYRLERVELRLGDPAREIAVFTKGRPLPVSLEVEQVLAVAQSLLNTEALEEAQETLEGGLRHNPGDRLLRLARANVLLTQDEVPQAIEILKGLAGDFPSDPLVLVNLGGAFLRAGQLDEAGAAACTAYALAPENEDVCLLMEVLEPSPMTPSSPHLQNQSGRHFDFGKPIGGRDEVTRYFAERYEASSILDIGCGSGPVWRQFFDKGMTVTGVDLVPKDVVMAGHPGHAVNYLVGDFLEVQLPDTYDAVYSSHTIEHVPDTERFLRRFFSYLRPGGAFCLIWPPPKPEVVSGHVHVFNLGLMLYNLVRLGVDCRKVEMVRCGYCLALMGRYQRFSLPELTHNEGDLDRLGAFFPFQAHQGFDGDHPAGVVDLPVAEPGIEPPPLE